jgi:hypothetical protein
MFAILITLNGAGIAPVPDLVASWKPTPDWKIMQEKDPYNYVMGRNAQEGVRFMKPLEGHEDGCIMGVCKERSSGVADDGVLHAPQHIPVSRLSVAA